LNAGDFARNSSTCGPGDGGEVTGQAIVARIPRDLPLVQGLTRRELAKLEQLAREQEFQRGEVMIREGELADEMYVVLSGSAEILRRDRRGADFVIADIGPGDLVG
jgi:CRP-like cAMP-binding protein